MIKIELLGIVSQMSLEELANFVKELKVPDLEIAMSMDRFEIWTSMEDVAAVSLLAAQVLEKAKTLSNLHSKITFNISKATGK